jgi:hypothetical protein
MIILKSDVPKGKMDSFKLVSDALSILGIVIEIVGDEFKIRQLPPLRAYAVNECVTYLSSHTGPDLAIDPFREADGNAWVSVSDVLSRLGLRIISLQISRKYVELCYSLQDRQGRRMDKGAPSSGLQSGI